jgi:F-type H+-transporting ATPase subunit c
MEYEAATQIAAALAIGLGGMMPALAIGLMASKAMEAIGRNPESSGNILTNMILAIAFAEAIAIYALVVALAIKFVPVTPLH